jgi:hypothetical protein
MKKQTKKLKLAKETVRSLDWSDLNAVAGAVTTEPCIDGTQWYKCWGTYGCPTRTGPDPES